MSLTNFERLSTEYTQVSSRELCYAAAVDCISLQDVPLHAYLKYGDLIAEEDKRGASRDLKYSGERTVLEWVGVGSPDDVKKVAITHPGDLRTYLLEAKKRGERVLVLPTPEHVVGAIPTESGKWRLVGQSVPTQSELDEYEIFNHIYPISWMRAKAAYNLEILPAET